MKTMNFYFNIILLHLAKLKALEIYSSKLKNNFDQNLQ
jgi:hypothetical protein